MNKRVLIPLAIIVGAAVGVIGYSYFWNSAQAQPVPNGAYFNTVKKLSAGRKPACLTNNAAAETAVSTHKPQNYGQSLDIVLGSSIPDMPAGMYDSTVHEFKNNQARGTITFSDKNQRAMVGDLKNFNYTASVRPDTNEWKLTQLIACQR